MLLDLFLIILGCSFLIVALLGYGSTLCMIVGVRFNSSNLMVSIIGFTTLNFITELISIFLKIDLTITLVVIFLGILLALFNYAIHTKEVSAWFLTKIQSKKVRNFGSIFGLIIILFCIKAMDEPVIFDTGLYHLQTIKWINEFPVVHGLGNLHGRLAFNQSWHVILALLNYHPFGEIGFAIGGVSIMILSFGFIYRASDFSQSQIITPILLIAVFTTLRNINSSSPDLPLALLEIVAIVIFFELILFTDINTEEIQFKAFTLIFCCVFISCIKLNGMIFSTVFIIATIAVVRNTVAKSFLFITVALGLIFSSPHIYRGFIMSGYPFFPLSFGGLDKLPWSVPSAKFSLTNDWIMCWARTRGVNNCLSSLNDWSWFGGWIKSLHLYYKIHFVFTLVFLCFSVLKYRYILKDRISFLLLFTNIGFLTIIVIWFYKAPDPRFLGSIPNLFLCTSILLFDRVYNVRQFFNAKSNKVLKSFVFLTVIACFLTALFWKVSINDIIKIGKIGFIQPHEINSLIKYTESGDKIYMPEVGAQCFNHKLPCTPIFDENLIFNQSNRTFSILKH